MSFAEINLFGVYVAPISLMMIGAWFVTIALRLRRQPLRLAAIRLASGSVRVRRVHRRSLDLGTARRAEVIMTITEVTAKRSNSADEPDAIRLPQPAAREPAARRSRIVPFMITLAAVALAGWLGWATWGVYMGAPWTRDATVRAYVVTMAPEVAGRIVELPVVDNGYVHKGDLLMVIDPTNYHDSCQSSRGSSAAGAGERAEHRRADRRSAGADQRNQAQLDRAKAALVFAQQQACALPETREGRLGHRSECSAVSRRNCISRKLPCRQRCGNLNLAQRQIDSLKAQRLSAEATARAKRGADSARRRWISSARAFSPRSTAT